MLGLVQVLHMCTVLDKNYLQATLQSVLCSMLADAGCSVLPEPISTCVHCCCSQLADRLHLTSLDVNEYAYHPNPGSLYGSMAVVSELPALGSQLRQLTLRPPRGVVEHDLDPLGMMTGLEELTVQPRSPLDLSMASCISRLTNLHTLRWYCTDRPSAPWQVMASYYWLMTACKYP